MAFKDFLNHTCDIYHLRKMGFSPNPALKSQEIYGYDDTPDIENQACHFGVKNMSLSVNQKEPFNLLEGKIKLTFPIGTDVRVNDKIVERTTGLEFTAETPRNVQNHHIFTYIERKEIQKEL